MTDPTSTLGVDCRRRHWLIAQVRHENGRPAIERLLRHDIDDTGDSEALRSERVVLAVPDDLALIKPLRLNGSGDTARQAAFEMAQAVLADESAFLFDSFPTALDKLVLGTAIRRSVLIEKVIDPYRRAVGVEPAPMVLPRAVALGRGYAAYGFSEGGDVTAVVDLGSEPVSLCIVHAGHPAAIGHFDAARFNLNQVADRERLAIELKTIISFKLASLFEHGLTRPLSGLAVTGIAPDDPVMAALSRFFTLPVTHPRLNLEPSAPSDPPEGDFLAALGLAAI